MSNQYSYHVDFVIVIFIDIGIDIGIDDIYTDV